MMYRKILLADITVGLVEESQDKARLGRFRIVLRLKIAFRRKFIEVFR